MVKIRWFEFEDVLDVEKKSMNEPAHLLKEKAQEATQP